MSKTRYLQSKKGKEKRSSFYVSFKGSRILPKEVLIVRCDSPKQMKEIRLDKIGFNILADTDNVGYALLLKDWQLQQNATDNYCQY